MAPVRRASQPRVRPVWEKVRPRIDVRLAASKEWTGGKQQLTATCLHELLIGEGRRVGASLVKAAVAGWKRQRREIRHAAEVREGPDMPVQEARGDEAASGLYPDERRQPILGREPCDHLCGAGRVLVDQHHHSAVMWLDTEAFCEHRHGSTGHAEAEDERKHPELGGGDVVEPWKAFFVVTLAHVGSADAVANPPLVRTQVAHESKDADAATGVVVRVL